MSINIRTIESTNSHLSYNTNVTAGEPVIEFARFGSVLVNRNTAIAALSAFLAAHPDSKPNTSAAVNLAINYGLRILIQNAISGVIRKPLKTAATAESLVSAHIPGLIGPTNTP